MDNHEIIVVGAGPAGLNAGYYAAKNGAEVLILDKKPQLGLPVRCGEATVESIFKDFKIKPTKDLIANEVSCLKLYSSKGQEIDLNIKMRGYILNRDKFEQHLGDLCIAAGVDIKLNSTVTGLKKNKIQVTEDNAKTTKTLTGKIIIAADGVESRVGRWAGVDTTLKPEDIAVCQQYVVDDIELERSAVEFYWGAKYSPHAYIWVFPKSDNRANVGIVSLGSIKVDLGKLLNEFIKHRAPKCRKVGFIAGCVPQAEPPVQLVKNNVMLIGDAARVALPVTGAGIGHALITGKWSGEVAAEVINNRSNIEELLKYEIKMKTIRRKIRRSFIMKQKILRDDPFFEIAFAIAKPVIKLYKYCPELFHKYFLKSLRY